MISLALAGAERAHGVPLYSTGPRQPVPPDQERFWLSTAQDIIDSLIAHFRAISPQSPVALELQRPESWAGGDHLSPGLQERCVPRHIFEALNVWLTDQCASSDVRTSLPVVPSPFVRSAPDPPLPRSPFGPLVQPDQVPNVVPAGGNLPASSPVVTSHPFVGVPTQGGQSPATIQFAEGGPVRLTRFVEMSLESYYAHLNQMISQGRFEHIGRASIRLEGATAWGVWLRRSSALGNRPRLRCGALHHVANRTVTFHGVARDAARLLVPLFEGWTLPSISQLPSVQRDRVDVVVPVEPVSHGEQSSHSVASPLPPPSEPPASSRGLSATWCIN